MVPWPCIVMYWNISLQSHLQKYIPIQQYPAVHCIIVSQPCKNLADSVHLFLLSFRAVSGMAKLKHEMDSSQWLCITCHDWSCLCQKPSTVRKHSFGNAPLAPPLKATVYERIYVAPTPLTWVDNKKTPDQLLAETSILAKPKPGTLLLPKRHKQIWSKASCKSNTGMKSDDEASETETVIPYEYYFEMLSKCPITARKPFLVSSAHWASKTKRHTQPWPWQSHSQCRLWSSSCQFDLAKTPRHTACWNSCRKWAGLNRCNFHRPWTGKDLTVQFRYCPGSFCSFQMTVEQWISIVLLDQWSQSNGPLTEDQLSIMQ